MSIVVLGAGKMMAAILEGLKGSADLSQFHVFSPSGTSAKNLALKVGAKHLEKLVGDISPTEVWIGCKPQQLPELKILLGDLYPEATYFSLLAALPEEDQLKILDRKKLVRAMPNLSVAYQSGVTLLTSTSAQEFLPRFEVLFSRLGLSKVVSEAELEELTLLTGSGPAFFYEFAQALAGSFTSLSAQEREALVRQVLLGAGVSAKNSEAALGPMIDAVTSKGGVTIAVLEKFRERNLREVVKEGIERGRSRSQEIKDLLRRS